MRATTIARKLIIAHEGVKSHVYDDSLGIATIGIGRNVSPSGPGLRQSEIDAMLDNDINCCLLDLKSYPFWISLNDNRRAALIDMRFQLGGEGFRCFRATISLLNSGSYEEASQQMLKSKWATQTPKRAKEISEIIRTGVVRE